MIRLDEALKEFQQELNNEVNTTSNVSVPDVKFNGDEEETELEEEDTGIEEMFARMIDSISDIDYLSEISYSDFIKDETKSNRQKVNGNINKMYSKLKEVEQLCNHALKLKGSLPNNQKLFWKNTYNKMSKTMKLLSNISIKVRELNK